MALASCVHHCVEGAPKLIERLINLRTRWSGIATGDAEGEREVAGAEHDDRSDRDPHPAQVCLGDGLSVGEGAVDASVDP